MGLLAIVICLVSLLGVPTVSGDNCPRFPYNLYPECTPRYVNITIEEGLKKGTEIVQLNCTDPDNTNGGTLTWKIDSGNTKGIFKIDKNGLLTTKKKPDAEGKVNPYTLYITAADAGDPSLSSLVVINIVISSINDEPPMITGLPATVDVPEDSPIGAIIAQCTLEDADTSRSPQGLARIEIISGNADNFFRLDPITCALSLNQRLDYESMDPRTLLLRARDLDIAAPLTTEQNITINILDVNDHRATCQDYIVFLTVPEDLAVGEEVTSLNCSDVDVSDRLQYTIAPGFLNYLSVDVDTGLVTLNQPLDFETLAYFDVAIHVHDLSAAPFTTTVIVSVEVTDVDDNIPLFTPSTVMAEVAEDAEIGDVIVTLNTSDADSADTFLSTITFTLQTTSPSVDWFSVDSSTGVVFVSNLLDYEATDQATLVVTAYSSNKTTATSTTSVTITVTDTNDNAPVFNQTVFEGFVTENAASGTPVAQVFASDADSGVNADISFTLNSTLFSIDPTSGVISLTGSVDYESMKSHLVVVTATDTGTPSLSSQVVVKVTVEAENEYTPMWIVPAADGEVRFVAENTAPGTSLFSVSATDTDAGEDGIIRYFLIQPGTDSPFSMHPQLGLVTIVRTLDRETLDSYTLVIEARDSSATQQKSVTASVTVSVSDYNDNAPVCDPPPQTVVDGFMLMPGDTIYTLTCSDADSGSGSVKFFKVGGDSMGVFSVDRSTGAVRLGSLPTEAQYTINVEVRDGGTPELSSFMSLTFITANSLVFKNLPDTVAIAEDARPGDIVHEVNVTGTSLPVFFSIVGGDGTFQAEPSSGKIVLASELDRETTDRYDILIAAWTAVGYTAMSSLTITVSDVNDNRPTVSGDFNISVAEDLPVPTTLCTFSAQDDDYGTNGEVSFSIIQGNDNSLFAMDSDGTLRLVSALDAETSGIYILTIRAQDGGNPPLVVEHDVVIVVEDVDEHPPRFGFTNRQIFVSENKALGSKLIQIQGPDRDVSDTVRMDIISGNDDGTFIINRISGEMYLAKLLNYESISEYTLTIQATNFQQATDTMVLIVTIRDVNDNPPTFSKAQYMFQVQHDAANGTLVGQLQVTDADSGVNAQFDIQIMSGDTSNVFLLDGTNLVTAATIDASLASSYSLVIRATDQGLLSSETTVIVNVLPENASPKFLSHEADVTVPENSLTGQVIYDLQATLDGAMEGESGDLNYTVISGNELGFFYLDVFTGEVYIPKNLDFETASSHSLIIRAENRNDIFLADVMNLTVYVTNVNDDTPVFTQHEYVMTMDEGLPAGTSIGQVSAQDSDAGPFGQIQYSLEPTSKFTIDSATGEITLQEVLRYSDQSFFRLLVYASDNAGPASFTSTAAILVLISDVNEHAPSFPDAPFDVTVPESVTSGMPVLVLMPADDDDGETNGQVTCGIMGGNEAGLFTIDPSSCVLGVAGTLDYETQTEFNLTVIATDSGSPSKTGVATVLVHMTDVNDNAPIFASSELHTHVQRVSAAGTEVVTVTATDVDSGKNAEMTYTLLSGNDDGYFSVDPFTGKVETLTDLTLAADTYTLVLTATESGLPAMTGSVTVSVDVTPFVSPPPADLVFTVTENSPAGTEVGTVTSDPALSVTSHSIVSGNFNNNFRIATDASGNGRLLTNGLLDRETYAVYHLTIEAYHGGGTETTQVTVNVDDVNDNTPSFVTGDFSFPVVENLAAGATVEKLTVTDADEGQNAAVSLTISPSTPICSVYLQVEPDGSILIKTPVDYEVVQSFQCKVIATDNGSPALTASVTLTVDVIDITEQIVQTAGASTSSFLSLEIPHTAAPGRLIHTLTASDFNMIISPGDSLQFISVSQDGVFLVDSNSGEVTVGRSEFLYESSRYFQWVVCVHSGSGGSDTQLAMLRVDTFNMNKHVVAVTLAVGVDYLDVHEATLESRLQQYFTPEARVEVLEIRSLSSSGGSRRRLLSEESVALVYVVGDTAVDTAAGVDQAKTFLTQDEILQALQLSSDGTPVPGMSDTTLPVQQVMPYNSDQSSVTEEFLDTAEGFALVLVLIILCVIVAVFFFICCLWRIYKRRQRRTLVRQPLIEKGAKKDSKDTTLQSTHRPSLPDEDTTRLLDQLLPVALLTVGRFTQTPPSSTNLSSNINDRINSLRNSSKMNRDQAKSASEKESKNQDPKTGDEYGLSEFESTEETVHEGHTVYEEDEENMHGVADNKRRGLSTQQQSVNGSNTEDLPLTGNVSAYPQSPKFATYLRTTRTAPLPSVADNNDPDVRVTSPHSSTRSSVTSPRSILINDVTTPRQHRREKSDLSISFRDDVDNADDLSVDEMFLEDTPSEPTSSAWADTVKSTHTKDSKRGSRGFVGGLFNGLGKWGRKKLDESLPKRFSMPDALRVSPATPRRGSTPAYAKKSRDSFDSCDGIHRWLRDSSRFTEMYRRGGTPGTVSSSARSSTTGRNSPKIFASENSSSEDSTTGASTPEVNTTGSTSRSASSAESQNSTLRLRKLSQSSVDESDVQDVHLSEDNRKRNVDRPEPIPSVRRQSFFV